MAQNAPTVDLVARVLAVVGLGVALFVGLVNFLTYRRGRWQETIIHIHSSESPNAIIRKPALLLTTFFIDNPSVVPNTIVGIGCKSPGGMFNNCDLKVSNLELAYANVQESGVGHQQDLRLAIAPQTALEESDWKALFGVNSAPPTEGLWRLPLPLPARSSTVITVAITSEKVDLTKTRRLFFCIRDITGKSHLCSIRV